MIIRNNYLECVTDLLNYKIGLIRCDTIWGLVGIMSTEVALRLIQYKKRPPNQPFIILVDSIANTHHYTAPLSSWQTKLLHETWPSSTTLILPKKKTIPEIITGGQDTIGIRVPHYTPLQQLLAKLDLPLISTSANISGTPTPEKTQDIPKEITKKIDFICTLNEDLPYHESTIIDATTPELSIIRQSKTKSPS